MKVSNSYKNLLGRPRHYALEGLCFFLQKITISAKEVKKHYNFETTKGRNLNSTIKWGTYESFLVQILEAIGLVIPVSEPKTELPIGSSNSSSSKTNRTRKTKVSNLKASGHAVAAPKNKL